MWLAPSEKYSETTEYLNFNWTKPLFIQILYSLNNSVNRPYEVCNHNDDYSDSKMSYIIPPQCGVIFSIIFIIIFHKIFFKKEYTNEKNKYLLKWPSFIDLNIFLSIFSLLLFIIISPLIILMMSIFFIHKKIAILFLKIKYGENTIKTMSGMDTVWAMEEENAKSIINVICMVEYQTNLQNQSSDSGDLLKIMRKKMASKLDEKNNRCSKLLYRRSNAFGYHFWKIVDTINIDDIIKPMDIIENNIDDESIQNFVSNQANENLPYNNSFSWEILIGTRPVNGTKTFPILFRIHHCLGDGVALLKLLLNTVGTVNREKHYPPESFKESTIYFYDIYDWRKIYNNLYNCITKINKYLKIIYLMPACLFNQILRPPDENILHGPILSGKKIISWISDDHDSESLLYKIKRIKKNIPGATFSELFLSALSISMKNYFNQNQTSIPDFFTAVVPIRMDTTNIKSETINLQLENKFSVAMLTVPMDNAKTSKYNLNINQLISVRRETNELRKKSDFYVNYWLMKVAGSILPEYILKPMLTSVQATLVVSNLPGPSNITICDFYKLQKIAFFVPHRGTTGIGITIISCNDRINLGIMADSKLISKRKEATDILRNIITQLEQLDYFTRNSL